MGQAFEEAIGQETKGTDTEHTDVTLQRLEMARSSIPKCSDEYGMGKIPSILITFQNNRWR